MFTPITSRRAIAIEKFRQVHRQARNAAYTAKLFGRGQTLACFETYKPFITSNKKYLGIQDIPLESIIGSIGRNAYFDAQFRPLKKHLLERWVSMVLALDEAGWPPIVLHKIGDKYFVEDGHHRVSVAHCLGVSFLGAEVWEHPLLTLRMLAEQGLPAQLKDNQPA